MKIINDELYLKDNEKMVHGTLYKVEKVKAPCGKVIFQNTKIGDNKIMSPGSQIVACKMNFIPYKYEFNTVEEMLQGSPVTLLEDSYRPDLTRIVGATTVGELDRTKAIHPLNMVYAGIMLLDDGFDSGNIKTFNAGDYEIDPAHVIMWRANELPYDIETQENFLRQTYDLYAKNEVGAVPIYGYMMKKVKPELSIVTPTGTFIDDLNPQGITNLLTYVDFDIAFVKSDILQWCKFMYGDDAAAKFSSVVLCIGLPMLHNEPATSTHSRFKDIVVAHRVNISEESINGNDDVVFKYRVAIK